MTTRIERLTAEFAAWIKPRSLSGEGDALELLHRADLSTEERAWLSHFIKRWDAAEIFDRDQEKERAQLLRRGD